MKSLEYVMSLVYLGISDGTVLVDSLQRRITENDVRQVGGNQVMKSLKCYKT